ncbi:SUKH-4 family immunity protein [Actinomadura sp. 6N118]|uniref:SUKH-4 family immunity protein n=1 Tax=Actinomadura sp. 6N118 TaxID=3375151 RepID=UPI0037B69B3F
MVTRAELLEAFGEEDVVTLEPEAGREMDLSEGDLALLTEVGLPRFAGGLFTTDLPDDFLELFSTERLPDPESGDTQIVTLGGITRDDDARYFLDTGKGWVVLFTPGDAPGEAQTEVVNSTLEAFTEFVYEFGRYLNGPEAESPSEDRARLVELGALLKEHDPDAFRHPHCWWAMAIDQFTRNAARRERAASPARSQSDAFDRALDRLIDEGWQLVEPGRFAEEVETSGLLCPPADFSDAFSSDGALIGDVALSWRGGLTSSIQSAFAREGLVVSVPGQGQDDVDMLEDMDEEERARYYDATMEALLAAAHGPYKPEEGTVTCLATEAASDLCRIVKAFDRLAAQGYYAEPALWPTTSGCWEQVHARTESGQSPKTVFWNTQSHDSDFNARGDLIEDLHVHWAGDRDLIAEALAETGLKVRVPGDDGTTFILSPA